MLGWRTMIQLFARRAAESNAFSVPDHNALWSTAEDDLLVQAVAKHSTSDVLFRDWREVAWELPGRSEQQCKERYRLADTVVELTFIFLRVTFRGSPFLRSSHVLTKDADSADSARPIHYSTPVAKLTHLSVYDSTDGVSVCAASPSSPSSLTHVHRCIGSRNATRPMQPTSAKLTYLSVYDSRDGVSESHTLLTPTLLTFMCTQVLWCLALFARPRASGVTMAPDIRLTILSTRVHSQVLSLLLTSFLSLGVPVQRTT